MGFSLIELSISVTTMTIVGFLVSNLIYEQSSSVGRVEDRFSSLALEQQIMSLLANEDHCNASFVGRSVTSNLQDVNLVTSDGGSIIATSGPLSSFDRIQVTGINFQNSSVLGPDSGGKINLNISLTRDRSIASKSMLKPVSIPVYVRVDGTQRITECSTNASLITNRTVASAPSTAPSHPGCTYRHQTLTHGQTVPGNHLLQEACDSQYACLYGMIVPEPASCRSGRNGGD